MPESAPKTLVSPRVGSDPDSTLRADTCLKVDEALSFAQGRVKGAELAALNSHVDACEPCQQVVEEALRAYAATDPVDSTAGSRVTFRDNAIVGGRYLIRRFVIRGGMGEVYEAYDNELREVVALKTVMLLDADNERSVRRLKAEVQLARRVSHPNVCRIYDLGLHLRDGVSTYFLTMEFVNGESLGRRIRRAGALPIAEVVELARQLLRGLGAAHRAGVLHRDFKSDNVMLRSSPSGPNALILDFGLARALDNEGGAPSSSQDQGLVGTMGYMAPEQIEGLELGPASDLYAFGVVCFEMLTGVLPFAAPSLAASVFDRLRRPAVAPSSLNEAVPSALDAIVLRCLARVPAERYQSSERVLAALEAQPQASLPALEVRRRPGTMISTVVLAGLLLALVAQLAWRGVRPTSPNADQSSSKRVSKANAPGSVTAATAVLPTAPAPTHQGAPNPEPDVAPAKTDARTKAGPAHPKPAKLSKSPATSKPSAKLAPNSVASSEAAVAKSAEASTPSFGAVATTEPAAALTTSRHRANHWLPFRYPSPPAPGASPPIGEGANLLNDPQKAPR